MHREVVNADQTSEISVAFHMKHVKSQHWISVLKAIWAPGSKTGLCFRITVGEAQILCNHLQRF